MPPALPPSSPATSIPVRAATVNTTGSASAPSTATAITTTPTTTAAPVSRPPAATSNANTAPTRAQRHKQRIFRGRQRRGQICSACRAKHKKCDGGCPCGPCIKAGTSCLFGSAALIVAPGESQGRAPFHRFVNQVAILMPFANPTKVHLWEFILPSAQSNESILNAVSAFGFVWLLPLSQATSLALPKKAIEYYCESLAKPVLDIGLLVLVSHLYIEIETCLAHYQNIDNVVRSVFAVIHSMRAEIIEKHLKDRRLCSSLRELLERLFSGAVDTSVISKEHWVVTMTLLLRISAEVEDEISDTLNNPISLQVETANIMYDLNKDGFDDPVLDYRIKSWQRKFSKLKVIAPKREGWMISVDYFDKNVAEYELAGHFHQWHINKRDSDRVLLAEKLEKRAQLLESLPHWRGSTNPFIPRMLDQNIVPQMLLVVFYSRDAELATRMKQILARFTDRIAYHEKVVAYLDTLLMFPVGQSTALEIEVFGPEHPFIEKPWQIVRLANQLAKPS